MYISFLTILLTITVYPLITHAEETVIGELKFSFFFDSVDGRLPSGQTCDPWPDQNCDIYLKICVKSPEEESCDVFNKQTQTWQDTHVGQTTVSFSLKKHSPKILEVTVEAWDHDPMNNPDLIARFQGQLLVAETPNTASIFKMEREDFRYINNFRLDSYVHIVCSPFHYGGDCSRKCIPDPKRYACDIDGFKRCRAGFIGVECNQRDYCLLHNCSDFAECKNTPTGFECWCEGRSGPQCQLGYDPCAEEHMSCSGHGACSRTGKYKIYFECACDVGWEGEQCEVRRPVCVVASETNQTICLNGGICKDLNAERGAYICECTPGWWGQHCEKKTAIIYKMVFAIIIYVAIGLIALTTLISLIVFFCKRKQKPTKPRFTYMHSTQLPQAQSGLGSPPFSYVESGGGYTYTSTSPIPIPPVSQVSPIKSDHQAIAAFV